MGSIKLIGKFTGDPYQMHIQISVDYNRRKFK